MGSRLTINVKGDWDFSKLIAEAEKLDGRKVVVGPQGDRNRDLAKIHEYGCLIPVTDKMRGYLASQGLHLKQSTKFITIPERSFIRNGWDTNEMSILRKVTNWAGDLGQGSIDTEELLDKTGELTTNLIKNFARDLDSPSNHPFTIEQKGSDNPLIESGSMVGSIDYEKK